MGVEMKIDFEDTIKQLKELVGQAETLKNNVAKINFITPAELAEKMHCTSQKAREIFNRKDFPACNYGKVKVAEVGAVIKYFSVRRDK